MQRVTSDSESDSFMLGGIRTKNANLVVVDSDSDNDNDLVSEETTNILD